MTVTLHLRSESKPLEHRSALTPTTTKQLLDAGFKVNVERSPMRVFEDREFEEVGATLVPDGSWPDAPTDNVIIGLKELPEDDFALKHTHVQFAHCYKSQKRWDTVLQRFPQGGGTLLDLEFLQDDVGRRIAAFGYHAGFAGAALAVEAWAWQITHPPSEAMPGVSSYPNQDLLIKDVRAAIAKGEEKAGRKPMVLIIGALGRCGRGAVDLCKAVGLEDILQWDMEETKKGGPFMEIVESDILVNCIYLDKEIFPFINSETLASPERKLSVVCDVSCDTTNPHNPIPIYTENSTFDRPCLAIQVERPPPLCVISIDNLPSLLPREASEAFSNSLLPSLMQLQERSSARVWQQALQLFNEKVQTLPESMRRAMAYMKG